MWNLDDNSKYVLVHQFEYPKAFTWGDKDPEKREFIRAEAKEGFPASIPDLAWWAFRIYVKKGMKAKKFDVDNVVKLVVDAFCRDEIVRDQSGYPELCLYEKDTIDVIRVIQVAGERTEGTDHTYVEIFGRIPETENGIH